MKYMIVISFDAVSSKDLEILKTLPNFKELIKNGSLVENVESVYPSLTYPAHTTIVTGKYPKNHGIIDNTIFKLNDFNPNWYWYKKYIKCPTLYDLAKEKGLKTCSLLWPVTARSSNTIDYNMPEIFAPKPYQNQMIMSAFAGTLKFQLDINKKFGHIRKGISQPALDNFVTEAFKYTIEKYKPNLTFVHFTDVDTQRHNFGYFNKEVKEALYRHDKRLGEIVASLKKVNIYNETSIVALGDHSQLNVKNVIRLNKLFLENGLIEVNNSNKIINYKAISKSLDGSCYIYIKDKKYKSKIEELLKSLKNKNLIDFYLNNNEILLSGADSNADFMLEASYGYYFIDTINGKFIENVQGSNFHKATHGYSPKKKDYGTFFIGSGVGFRKNVVLPSGKLINHGPTLAKILGVDLKDTDGQAVLEILDI